MLGGLSSLANQSLSLVEGASEKLAATSDLVVRVRLERPAIVIYALLHKDGVEFLSEYEGQVDIRIRSTLGDLLQFLLMPDSSLPETIHVQGDETQIASLAELLDHVSFWAVARGWLDRYVRMNDLLGLLGKEDPKWLTRLQGLPENVRQLAQDLARQHLLQEDILQELVRLRHQLGRQRRLDLFFIVTGLLLLFGALSTMSGNLPLWLAHQTALLGSAGAAMLLSRLLSPT